MKFYKIPKFCFRKKYYYSLYTSFFLCMTSLYLFEKKQTPRILQRLLFLVGVISMIHHCRSFQDDYDDFFRIIDIIFANLLGLCILYLYPNQKTFTLLTIICFLFFHVQFQCKSNPQKQSILHSFIHMIVIIIIFSNL